MDKGFIMLSKELMNSEYYFSERFTRMQAYIDLCLLAEWKDRKFIKRGQVVELKAGQLAKSEEELAERWQWSRNTVRKYLNEQQSIGNIEQRKSRLITVITVKFGVNFAQQTAQQTPIKTAQQIAQQIAQPTIDNNIDNIKDNNKEKETEVSKKKPTEYPKDFESDWVLYDRKGSKKDAFTQWKKLSDDDKQKMRVHIQYYKQSNKRQFWKDFERYIQKRVFDSPVYKDSVILFDPIKNENPDEYHPLTDDVFQTWNEERKCLRFNGDLNHLNDGYNDDNRPDGAMVAWGMYSWKWSKQLKQWIES